MISARKGPLVALRRFTHDNLIEFGRRLPELSGKRYKVGTHFVHAELGYRGVVLFPWEAQLEDFDQTIYSKVYYQALVDSRDADDLPMELETLRVTDENSTHKKDVKPIRFKNWDLVSHDEVMRYFPVMTTDPTVFKHHLLHHFLEEKKAKNDKIRTKATPTLKYWQKKFSSDLLNVTRGFGELNDSELTIQHTPYYLCQKLEGHLLAHLARFTFESLDEDPVEIYERVCHITTLDGDELETNQLMSIFLGGDFNHIYQHSRHIEVPLDTDTIMYRYLYKNTITGDESEILLPPIHIHQLL